MDIEEARAWLRGGERSKINLIPTDPIETWELRIAQTDAAMMQQAYYMLKAHAEGLVVTETNNRDEEPDDLSFLQKPKPAPVLDEYISKITNEMGPKAFAEKYMSSFEPKPASEEKLDGNI